MSGMIISRVFCRAPINPLVYSLNSTSILMSCDLRKKLFKATYSTSSEEETPSPRLGVTHSWSSRGGSLLKRTSGESLMKDFYIRKFIEGTFPGYTDLVIQQKANTITVSFQYRLEGVARVAPSLYFLVSYVETILSYWLGMKISLHVRGYTAVLLNQGQS